MLIALAYTVVTNNKNSLKKIPINNEQNNLLILAILKQVQRQFFQCLKGKWTIVAVWQRNLTKERSLGFVC